MANALKHIFVSAKADGGDTSLVRPTDWNDEHLFAGGTEGYILVWQAAASDKVAWVAPTASGYFASGTRMVFDQDAAPTAWTRQNVTGERVIKLAGSGDTGQTEAGSWTIAGLSLPSHTHPIPHTHQITHPSASPAIGTGPGFLTGWYGVNTSGASSAADSGNRSNSAVDHDGSWRMANRICIVASKD